MPLQLLQFLSFADLSEMEQTCHELRRIVQEKRSKLSFFGCPGPTLTDPLFYYLFHRQYDLLEEALREKKDETNISPYMEYNRETRTYKPDRRRTMMNYVTWNDITLLEFAYLLHDAKAIGILYRYNRTICHIIRSCTSEFGNTAFLWATTSKDEKVIKALWNNYHGWHKEYIMRTFTNACVTYQLFF